MTPLIKLDIATFPCIYGLLKEAIEAAGVAHRMTADYALSVLHNLLEGKKTQVYVDNIGLPAVVIIFHIGPSLLFAYKQMNVLFIYAKPEVRSSESALEIVRTIEDAARAEECHEICVASWCYQKRDTYPDVSRLWEATGYQLQEKTYAKIIQPVESNG